MPIFEIDKKKYNVSDDNMDAFVQENPDAITIQSRNGEEYDVKASDYKAFIGGVEHEDVTPASQEPTQTEEPLKATPIAEVKQPQEPQKVTPITKSFDEMPKEYESVENVVIDPVGAPIPQSTQSDIEQPTEQVIAEGFERIGDTLGATQQMREDFAPLAQNMAEYRGKGAGATIQSGMEINPSTGKYEPTYISPTGRKYFNKGAADMDSFGWQETTSDMTLRGQLRKAYARLADLQAQEQNRATEILAEQGERNKEHAKAPLGFVLAGGEYMAQQKGDKEKQVIARAIKETEETIQELENQRERDETVDVTDYVLSRVAGIGVPSLLGSTLSPEDAKKASLGVKRFWDTVTDVGNASLNPEVFEDAFVDLQAGDLIAEDATPEERARYNELMEAKQGLQVARSTYGENASFMERAGAMAGQMPYFMLDFALTGGGFGGFQKIAQAGAKAGVKAIGKEAAEELAKKGVIKFVKDNGAKGAGKVATNWAIKGLGATANDLVRAGAMTNTIQAGKTFADVVERKQGAVQQIDSGEYVFENPKTWGEAITQAELNSTIENLSEMSGARLGFDSALSKIAGSKGVTNLLTRINAEQLPKYFTMGSNLLAKAGIDNTAGEIIEEYYGQAWRSVLNLDDAYKVVGYDEDNNPIRENLFKDGDFHTDIIGGMALTMGAMQAPRVGLGIVRYNNLKNKVAMADVQANELLGGDLWANMRTFIDNTTNEDMQKLYDGVLKDADATVPQKKAVLDYIDNSLQFRGFNLATAAKQRGEAMTPQEREVNAAYLDGYNITSAREVRDAENMAYLQLAKAREEFGDDAVALLSESPMEGLISITESAEYSQEQKDIAFDFVNAKAVFDGYTRKVKDSIDGVISTNDAKIDANTSNSSGMIQQATMKIDDRSVYIVNGSVVPYQDGSGIDVAKSDNTIIVRDAVTGALEQVSPSAIFSVGAPIDPSIVKENARVQAKQAEVEFQTKQKQADLTIGNVYSIVGEDGTPQSYQIAPNENGIIDNGDGTVNAVGADGVVVPISKDAIQQSFEDGEIERVAQFEEQRQMERDMARQSPYKMGDKVMLNINGESVPAEITTDVNADGKYVVTTERAINGNYNNEFSREELDSVVIPAEQSIEQGMIEPQQEQEQMTPPQPTTAVEQVPQDEKGNLLYEQVDSGVAWDAIVEQTEGDVDMARGVAISMLTDKQNALKTLQKSKAKGGVTVQEKINAEKERKIAIDNAQAEVDSWQAIVDVPTQREQAQIAQEVVDMKRAEDARLAEERAQRENPLYAVPDIVNDRPQDARDRGYRRENGQMVERQALLTPIVGNDVDIKFGNDVIPKGRVVVIDASQLQPSHIQGTRNSLHFLDEAQPKDRTDRASIVSARKMAQNIRPEEITSSVTAYTGAPTVNERGEVIQGNNRSDALKYMWGAEQEQAQKYKQYLIDNADAFGLDAQAVEAMDAPILVNMLSVDDAQAIELGQFVAQDTESGGVERIKALNTLQKMGSQTQTFAEVLLRSTDESDTLGQMVDRNAVSTLKWMAERGYISDTQYNSAFNSKGSVTDEAKNDLVDILYQNVFSGAPTRLREMFGSLPVRAQRAILSTAYRDLDSVDSERMLSEIQNSITVYYMLSRDAGFKGAKNYEDSKRAAQNWAMQTQFDDATGETYLPLDNFSNFAIEMAITYNNQTQKDIQARYNALYDLIQGVGEDSLFEVADTTPRTLAEAIAKTLNIEYNGQYGSSSLGGDTATSQQGGQEGTRDGGSNQQSEAGTELADNTAGVRAEAQQATEEQQQIAEQAIAEVGIGGSIVVVSNFNEIPRSEQIATIAIGSGKIIKGWYNVATGQAYLYAPLISDLQDAKETIWHEVVAHKGLRSLLSEQDLSTLLGSVWQSLSDDVKREMVGNVTDAEYSSASKSKKIREQAAEEYIARLAEKNAQGVEMTNVEMTVWEQIKAFVQDLLTRMGNDIAVTDADIQKLILASRENLMRGAEQVEASAGEDVRFRAEWRDGHSAPSYPGGTVEERVEDGLDTNLLEVVNGFHIQPEDYFNPATGARYYMYNTPEGLESQRAILNVAERVEDGDVDIEILAYRAIPNDVDIETLQNEDWVSLSRQYVENHGMSRFGEGNYKIITQSVPIRHLWWDGNDINEWGYDNSIDSEIMFRFTPEEQSIIDSAEDNAFKAPNGNDSNLTPKQWAQVRTQAFKDWFGDWESDPENASKVVDENGEPLVVYHGSTKQFYTFSEDKASVEGNLGASFYFTDNESDVNDNYFGGGVDFDNRVERMAERMADEREIEYEEAKEIVLSEQYNEDVQFEVFLNAKNPYYINENEEGISIETIINDYVGVDVIDVNVDEEAFYEQQEEALQRVIEVVNDAVGEMDVDFYNNVDQITNAVIEEFAENNALTYEGLRNKLDSLYLESEEGDLYSYEAVRVIFEEFGYDGIIDSTVAGKFRMNISSGTKHIAVFSPNQIKSATDNTGAFSEADNDIRFRFIGEKGAKNLDKAQEATIRLDNLAVAREMQEQGKDAKNIKLATGWELGADNLWRYEVADIQITAEDLQKDENKQLSRIADGNRSTLTLLISELPNSDNLLEEYPQMADYKVNVTRSYSPFGSAIGSFDRAARQINIQYTDLDRFVSTLNHEIQHAIQNIEGFTSGSSVSLFSKSLDLQQEIQPLYEMMLDTAEFAEWKRLNNRLLSMDDWNSEDANQVGARIAEITESGVLDNILAEQKRLKTKYGQYDKNIARAVDSPHSENSEIWSEINDRGEYNRSQYKRTAGEVEARNVQSRLGMTAEERLNSLAVETEDVAREDQIFIRDGVRQSLEGDILFRQEVLTETAQPIVENHTKIDHTLTLANTLGMNNVVSVPASDDLEIADVKGYVDANMNIIIVASNNNNVADAELTLLREGTNVNGLPEMFSGGYSQFLSSVFNGVSEPTRREITNLMPSNDWDVNRATEQYLGTLAEDAEVDSAIALAFGNMLAPAGFEFTDIPTNDLKYILWRNYQNSLGSSTSDVLSYGSDVAKREQLGVAQQSQPNNDDVLFRSEPPKFEFSNPERVIAREVYDKRVKTGVYQSVEAIQDSMLGLKEAMKAILEKKKEWKGIQNVAGFENAYLGENALSSRGKAELDAFDRVAVKPLYKLLAEVGSTTEEYNALIDYLMAKHGLERNVVMAEREAQQKYDKYIKKTPNGKKTLSDFVVEARKKDFSGLTALTGQEKVSDAEMEARNMVKEYEGSHDTTPIWDAIKKISNITLSKARESGLMSEQMADQIGGMYENYIPLRGFDEKISSEEYGYIVSAGRASDNTSISKKAKGRGSKADDPIANLIVLAERTILQGNRNMFVKQRFLNFVQNNPSDLASVSDVWIMLDEKNGEWVQQLPDNIKASDSPLAVEQKMQEFEERMQELAQENPDKYKKGQDAVDIPYRVVNSQELSQHTVNVKRNGRDYVITINGNPRAAQALNGMTNPERVDGTAGWMFNAVSAVNRWLSNNYTTLNPNFVLDNLIRDTIYTNSIVWAKEDPSYATRFMANYAKLAVLSNKPIFAMRSLFYKYDNGTLDMDNDIERMFFEFVQNGGETGYTNLNDVKATRKNIKKAIKREQSLEWRSVKAPISVVKGGGRVGKVLYEQYNEVARAVENIARFTAFMTSRQSERGIDRSIWDAKEISVNFNKKGSGGKFFMAEGQTGWGNIASFSMGIARLLYVFFNAAIQGTANIAGVTIANKAKALPLLASYFSAGMVIPLLASMLEDDDDKHSYFNMSEYTRRQKMTIKTDDGFITVSLPVGGLGSFYGMGEIAGTMLAGKSNMDAYDTAGAMLVQMSKMLPLSVVQEGTRGLIPSLAKPISEANANESWTGAPIYKDNDYNKQMPEWTKAYKSTNPVMVEFTKVLNDISGGDDFSKGAIDLNPAKWDYILKGMTGGLYQFPNQLVQYGAWVLGERDWDAGQMPFINRVYKSNNDFYENRLLNERYYNLYDEYKETERLQRSYLNSLKSGDGQYEGKLEELYNSPQMFTYQIFDRTKGDMSRLFDLLEVMPADDERELINDEIIKLRRFIIDEIDKNAKQ